MAIGFLTRDTVLSIKEERHKLLKRYEDGVWQLEHLATGRLIEKPEHELLESLRRGELRIVVDEPSASQKQTEKEKASAKNLHWNSLTDDERQEARNRWQYVSKALLVPRSKRCLTEVIKEVSTAAKDNNPPSVSTLKNWTLRYISSGRDLAALASQQQKRGNRTNRMESLVEQIVDASIDQVYLQLERGSMEDARFHAVPQIEAHNRLLPANAKKFPVPKIGYFFRRLAKHTKFDICSARFGLAYALRRFRNVLGFSHGEHPLQRIEIDHTPINLIVIDERSALPLGRPWLTIALDDNTRSVLGYYLSFEPPSYLSVGNCLIHALLPKTYVREKYPKIANAWTCFGVMETLVVDNGVEFHSQALEDAARSYGIDIQYCPKAMPWYKGKIERFLGTINRGIAHGIPGTTFSSILEREDYDAATTATITLAALHEIIHTWIIDFYHQKVHRALHDTPANRWSDCMQGMPIALPVNAPELEAMLAVPEERCLTFKGIELFNMFYNNDECRQLRIRLGADLKIVARYVPDDIGYIYIQEPDTQRMVKVPVIAKFKAYATGLSKWQHKVCRNYALRNLDGKSDPEALATAKARIVAIVEEQIFSKRRTLRKNAARYNNAGKVPPAPTDSPSTITPNRSHPARENRTTPTQMQKTSVTPSQCRAEESSPLPASTVKLKYVQRRA